MVRFKNRWFLVEFIPIGETRVNLDGKQIWSALRQSVISNFGDVGWGSVGLALTVKYFSPATNMCIIRVARDQHTIARGAVTLLTSIEGVKIIPNIIHVSGTIKHTQQAAITYNTQLVARHRALAGKPATYRDSYDALLESATRDIQALQD
ncbi:hypothetical protein C8J56DRAFT_1000989 [Mycena floridula]|nr:hypothetical protein C8J56DRAFT_1000989 [Mycena floridula]